MLTDTHIHLYYPDFNITTQELIAQAKKRGVTRFFLPNVDTESASLMYALHETNPTDTFMMMGIHPCSIKENWKNELLFVEQELSKKKFIAIGEIGMDLYWDKTFINEQKQAFEIQIKWALAKKLPFVIHCREAFTETLDIIYKIKKELNIHTFKGIVHCFSGNIKQAEEIIALGFHLGIGGVVTYKNSGLGDVVKTIDLKHLVLETDAPYLSPVPYRGKTNMPAYLHAIAEHVAFIKQISVKELANVTTENSKLIFGV